MPRINSVDNLTAYAKNSLDQSSLPTKEVGLIKAFYCMGREWDTPDDRIRARFGTYTDSINQEAKKISGNPVYPIDAENLSLPNIKTMIKLLNKNPQQNEIRLPIAHNLAYSLKLLNHPVSNMVSWILDVIPFRLSNLPPVKVGKTVSDLTTHLEKIDLTK